MLANGHKKSTKPRAGLCFRSHPAPTLPACPKKPKFLEKLKPVAKQDSPRAALVILCESGSCLKPLPSVALCHSGAAPVPPSLQDNIGISPEGSIPKDQTLGLACEAAGPSPEDTVPVRIRSDANNSAVTQRCSFPFRPVDRSKKPLQQRLSLVHDRDGTGSMLDDFFSVAAEQEMLPPGITMGRNHQAISRQVDGNSNEFITRTKRAALCRADLLLVKLCPG